MSCDVSLIMPTSVARRDLWSGAVRNALDRCERMNPELVICGDAETILQFDSNAVRWVLQDRSFPYTFVESNKEDRIGRKRNLAVAAAEGRVIIHWDDDDFRARGYVRTARTIIGYGGRCVGRTKLLFFDGDTFHRYEDPSPGRKWVAGGTLSYEKSLWAEYPFDETLDYGEDTAWEPAAKGLIRVRNEDDYGYVALIHGGNTSPKVLDTAGWSRSVGPDDEPVVEQYVEFRR